MDSEDLSNPCSYLAKWAQLLLACRRDSPVSRCSKEEVEFLKTQRYQRQTPQPKAPVPTSSLFISVFDFHRGRLEGEVGTEQ